MTDMTVRTTCRVCSSSKIYSVLDLGATPVGDAYFKPKQSKRCEAFFPVNLYFCPDCGLAQLPHVVNPDLLYGHFTYRTSISLGLVQHFAGYAKDILQEVRPSKSSFVVDIGSNDGSLLKFFKDADMRVLGIDPARDIAQEATGNGIETWDQYFNLDLAKKIAAQFGKADIVTTNNTFANIDDLHSFVQGIRELLSSNGTLVLETGYAFDLVNNGLFDNIYHEHLSYFPLASLIKLFELHKLKVVQAKRIATKGGSIRVYVQHADSANSVSDEVAAILTLEQSVLSDGPYFAYAKKLASAKDSIKNALDRLKSSGKVIAGYGASVGSTTFIYYFDLSKYLDFLVDDNSVKHGLLSPGTHLQVYSFEEAQSKNPDFIAIISWRYAGAIISRVKDYLEAGGAIINLYPELTVVDKNGTRPLQ